MQAAVLDRVNSQQLSEKDAAHLDMAYLRPAGHMVIAERDALYAYLLKDYRTDDKRRVHLFPVVTFVLTFLFCCTVVFPNTIALTLLLSGLTFVAQGALVALLQPFTDAFGHLKSVLAAAAKLVQCLVALGLISALNTSVIHGDAAAVHSDSQQQRLAAAAFRLFAANKPYIITLCALLAVPAVLALIGWRVREYFKHQQQRALRAQMEQQTDYSVTAWSRFSRKEGQEGHALHVDTAAADTEGLSADTSYDEEDSAIVDTWTDTQPSSPQLPAGQQQADTDGLTQWHSTAEEVELAVHTRGLAAVNVEAKQPESSHSPHTSHPQVAFHYDQHSHHGLPAQTAHTGVESAVPPPLPPRPATVTLPTAPPMLPPRVGPSAP